MRSLLLPRESAAFSADMCFAFTLPQHAARKSGTRGEIREAFSPMESQDVWAVSRHKHLEVKNIVSTIFFNLPQHAGDGTDPGSSPDAQDIAARYIDEEQDSGHKSDQMKKRPGIMPASFWTVGTAI